MFNKVGGTMLNKRNKIMILIGIGLFLVAGIVLVIAWKVAGWNIVDCLTGKTAIGIYIVLGLYLIACITIIVKDKMKV